MVTAGDAEDEHRRRVAQDRPERLGPLPPPLAEQHVRRVGLAVAPRRACLVIFLISRWRSARMTMATSSTNRMRRTTVTGRASYTR